jgi:hypothetical protein
MADSPSPLPRTQSAHFGAPSLIVKDLDLHTRGFLALIMGAIKEWNSDMPTVDRVRPPSSWGPTELQTLPFGAPNQRIKLPILDEDWSVPFLKRWKRKFGLAVLRSGYLFPVRDRAEEWKSVAVARDTFQEVLPLGAYMARPYHRWEEMSSDAAMSRLAFAGLGALRLMPYKPSVEDELTILDGAAWQHDLTFLSRYEVREGFEKYGARAIFNADQKPIAIYWCGGQGADGSERPTWVFAKNGGAEWEHAKWAWRCSLMVGSTVADHLVGVHWLIGNYVTTAARVSLPPTHYLRLLLKPFTWRTITINFGASETLCPKYGFVHRASALTYESLTQAFGDAVGLLEFHTVPELVRRKGYEPDELVEKEGVDPAETVDRFPWLADALALYKVIRAFVEDYIGQYSKDAPVEDDAAIMEFWRYLYTAPATVKFPDRSSKDALIDVLAQFIWSVTGLHEAVGTVNEYVVDPTFMGTKIRPGKQMADIQASMQYLLVMALTGLGMPRLMDVGDAAGVFDVDHRGKQAFRRFHDALQALSEQNDAANRRRMAHPTRPWPCETFNPKNLETGVSI